MKNRYVKLSVCAIVLMIVSVSVDTDAATYGGNKTFSLNTRDYVSIALDEGDRAFFVEAMVNGKKARLLLDTGAMESVMFEDVLPEYSLKRTGRKGQFSGIGGHVDAEEYHVGTFELENSALKKKTIWVIPRTSKANVPNPDVDGILGQDVIETYEGVIDHSSNRLLLKKKYFKSK